MRSLIPTGACAGISGITPFRRWSGNRSGEIILPGQWIISWLCAGVAAIRAIALDRPDLILLDIQMTPKNGIDTLREIRAMEDRADIPVIMLTGVEDKSFVLASVKLGICDYILKPFSSDDLLKRIQRVFEPEAQTDTETW